MANERYCNIVLIFCVFICAHAPGHAVRACKRLITITQLWVVNKARRENNNFFSCPRNNNKSSFVYAIQVFNSTPMVVTSKATKEHKKTPTKNDIWELFLLGIKKLLCLVQYGYTYIVHFSIYTSLFNILPK